MQLKTERITGIAHEILQCMYKEATPSANINFLLEVYEGQPPTWRKDYILPRGRQLGIFLSRCKLHNCSKIEKVAIAGILKDIVPMEQ